MSKESTPSTHGHVILRWLAETPLSDQQLQQRVAAEIGQGVRFHTCDRADLTLDALLALLQARGKIVAHAAGWQSLPERICGDGDGGH